LDITTAVDDDGAAEEVEEIFVVLLNLRLFTFLSRTLTRPYKKYIYYIS
jgi:hypothetical protein